MTRARVVATMIVLHRHYCRPRFVRWAWTVFALLTVSQVILVAFGR